MVKNENSLIGIYKKARDNRWCINFGCTTCGCDDVRREIYKLGETWLTHELTFLTQEDKEALLNTNATNVLELATVIFLEVTKEEREDDYPDIVKFVIESWKNEKRIWKTKIEKKNIEDEIAGLESAIRKKKKQLTHVSNKLINEKKRLSSNYERFIRKSE